jgi:TonB-linked SusC/RagA family outer membrane protein
MMKISRMLLFTMAIAFLMSFGQAMAQKSVRGTVKDAKDGSTLPGVNVVVKGTTFGTATDLDGNYSLSVPAGNNELEYTMVGYDVLVVQIGDRSVIDINLIATTTALDEVVVTGYGGTQKRGKLTNSISKVSEETLTTGLHSNPAQALSGAVPGLAVRQVSGNPGAVPTIILRGGTNLDGSGSPLVIVDGQIRTMSDINPNDIESMEVMKDAGATAIYGARANNGVILITTKRGKTGEGVISATAKVGLNYYNEGNYKFLGAEDYLYWMRTAYYNSSRIYQNKAGAWVGTTNLNSMGAAQPYGTGNRYFDANGNVLDGNKNNQAVWSPMKYTTDLAFLLDQGWKKMKDPLAAYDPAYDQEIIFKEFQLADVNLRDPSMSQDYTVNFSGGNDRGHYYAGLGYNYSNGTAVENWYQRLTFVFNADYKIKEWLTSYSSLNFADARWRNLPETQTSEQNYFSRVFSVPPTFRGTNENGEYLIGVRGTGDGNQIINADKFIRDNNNNKFTLNQSFKIDLLKGLYMKLNANWFYNESKFESFNKDYLSNVGPTYVRSRNSSAEFDRLMDQTYNAILNYDGSIKELHNISAMAGFEYYDSYNKGFYAAGNGAPTDDFMDLQYTSTKEGARSIDSWHSRQRIMSFFGRANYDYDEKYLLSAVLRYDGYSKLAADNRWGVFPGVSAGWVLSKEEFMQRYKNVLSFAKIRSSYGLNGNVSGIGNYYVQGAYSSNQYANDKGFLISSLPNPGLRWERSRTAEIGFDAGFLNNNYTLSATFYNRRTRDKFADITLPSHSGISSFRTNNGEIQNQGLELSLEAKVVNKQDLKVNVNLNAAYNVNKIIALPNNGLENNRQGAVQAYNSDGTLKWVGGLQEGIRPGEVYAFKALGIFKTAGEIPADWIDKSTGNNGSNNRFLYGTNSWATVYNAGTQGTGLPLQPGDVKFLDVNGDNILDNFDIVRIGNYTPTWTGGLTPSVTYKNLRLAVRTDFALGHVVNDARTPWIMGNMQGTYNSIELVKDTWSTNNPNGTYPLYVWADQLGKRNYARNSSMFIYKGDYMTLREVVLSYRLPGSIVSKMKMSGMEFSVTGQNLGYFSAAKNIFSPEAGADGWGGYPLPRTVIFSTNITF